jgi:type IV pilus assembly protein PilB
MVWRIGELLVQKKLISWEQLEDVLQEQQRTQELTGELLVRKRYISQSLLYKTLADQFSMRYVDLRKTKVNPRAIELIPQSIAEKYLLMPIEVSPQTLVIAISSPLNVWPEAELKKMTGMKDIKTVLALPDDIKSAIQEYYLPPFLSRQD